MIDPYYPVHVYRNLQRKCWSVRQRGLVVDHLDYMLLSNVTAHVQPAGRSRVLRYGVKNVHAYLKGMPTDPSGVVLNQRISYNPYEFGYFRYEDDTPYTASAGAYFTKDSVFVG